MLAKVLGAIAGKKLASKNNKVTGALVGAALPVIAKRGLGPLGLALGAGWVAKKAYDKYQGREHTPEPPEVATA